MTKEEDLIVTIKSAVSVLEPVAAFPCASGMQGMCSGDRMCSACRVHQALLRLKGAVFNAESWKR